MKTDHVRLSGRSFRPSSELEDGQSLSCYYTGIFRKDKVENAERRGDYPLTVVLGLQHFSIYWHGASPDYSRNWWDKAEQKEQFWEDYGVHCLFSFEFNDLNKERFEEWLKANNLISKDIIAGNESLYQTEKYQDWESTEPPTYGSAYFQLKTLDPWKKEAPAVFEKFLLDLLFDLHHSDLFRGHPSYSNLIGFLESVPLLKAIRLKAEYRYAQSQLQRAQWLDTSGASNAKKGRLEKIISWLLHLVFDPVETRGERHLHWFEQFQAAASKWLDYLRSPEGNAQIGTGNESNWFAGTEAEHNQVYSSSKEKFLRKQAEDSVQWLINRYAFGKAYSLQAGRIFSFRSKLIILLLLAIFCWGCAQNRQLNLLLLCFSLQSTYLSHYPPFFVLLIGTSLLLLCLLVGVIAERGIYFSFSVIYALASWLRKIRFLKPFSHRLAASLPKRLAPWLRRIRFLKSPSRGPEEVLLSIPKIISILRPKILLASAAVWTFVLSNDISWNLDFEMTRPKYLLAGLLLLLTFLFMAAHFNTLVSHKGKAWGVLGRGITVLILASIYSFTIGLLGMSFVSEAYFTKEERLHKYVKTFDVPKSSFYLKSTKNTYLYLGGELQNDSLNTSSQWLYMEGKALEKVYRRTEGINTRACFFHEITAESWLFDFTSSFRFTAVVDTLIFFTFVAVAVGILLEMGLKIQQTNIGFE